MKSYIYIIIVVAVILIGIGIYFLTKPSKTTTPTSSTSSTSPKSPTDTLLDNVSTAFGVNLIQPFKQENFDITPIFSTQQDIITNMNEFIKYAFPKANMDEINKLLSDNNLKKTAETIFNEHKNDTYVDFTKNFLINELLDIYYVVLYDEPNSKEVAKNVRLYIIVKAILGNLDLKDKKGETINNNVVNDLYLEMPNDYKTRDNILIYVRTNINKNIPINQVIDVTDNNENECLTTSLCKIDININDTLNNVRRDLSQVMNDFKRIFILTFSVSLFKLNNTSVPTNLIDEMNAFIDKYSPTS